MTIKNLYKYKRTDGGTTVSLEKPDVSYIPMYRVIADEGKMITKDGIKVYPVIDTDNSVGWYEVDAPNESF